MTDPVIHIPSLTHKAFKVECRSRGLRMRDVTAELISKWIVDSTRGNPPRKLAPLPTRCPAKSTTIDAYMAPPFWAGRNGG